MSELRSIKTTSITVTKITPLLNYPMAG